MITREKAIEILKYLIPIPHRGDNKSTSHLLITNALAMAIKALEQEPKTGHWMIVEDSIDLFFATYECSCCKRAIIVPHDAMKAVYKDYPYCHCGTKMVEPQEKRGEE